MEQPHLNLTFPEDLPDQKYLDPVKENPTQKSPKKNYSSTNNISKSQQTDGLGDIHLQRINTSFKGSDEELPSLRAKIKSVKDKSGYSSRDQHRQVFPKSDIFEASQTTAKHKPIKHIKSNLTKQTSCPESLLTKNGDQTESHSNYDKLYHTTDDIFLHGLKPVRTKQGGNYENESLFDGSERTSIIELKRRLKNSKRNVIDEYDRLGSNVSKKSSTSPRSPVISSQHLNETHLDLTQQYSKNDENITNGEFALIEFKSEITKKHSRFVKVALKEMIGKGGVAEVNERFTDKFFRSLIHKYILQVYKGLCCDNRNEIEVAVKLVGYNTINTGTSKGPETLEDLLYDPKNEMRVFKAFHDKYHGYSEESGIIEMIDGGEIINIEYSEYEQSKHDFKYVIITELGTKNFLKYIGDKIYERNGLSESELMEELVKPATVLFQMHAVFYLLILKSKMKFLQFLSEEEQPHDIFLPPELHSLLKSNLDKHYNAKDYASTKTDTWEFGILIFQMILLNERRYSTIDIDRWLYDVSNLAEINKFFTYLSKAKDWIIMDVNKFRNIITLLLKIMNNYPSLFLLATHLLDGEEANRLSAQGILDFLTSKCRIINKNRTFENFLEFGFKTKSGILLIFFRI
uniref:Protein kinase domain-containing protein n=1 Tax=Meloidogyne enterolobii TaxID=390850 RepID=A0A6V7UEP1_MELEN|nr:unnamed protein product [Meloidogyne enterolobii]